MRTFACLLVTLGCLLVTPPAAPACAVVGREGKTVDIASESALIVWDEKVRTQHFIRRASFKTSEPYFGFLVPTPTAPELGEVPDELFKRLEDWTRAEVRTRRVYRSPFTMSSSLNGHGVAVVDRQRVGGFDAAVLRGSDGKALQRWLEEHGYATRPGLAAWLEPYVKAGWFLTAFQIAKPDGSRPDVSTQAVRMSFTTDRPFFPYSEPADAAKGLVHRTRLLRVFLVSTERMQGGLEKGATWPGEAVWAGVLSSRQKVALTRHLLQAGIRLPSPAWLTVFDDPFSPRPGTSDLFFTPSPDQSSLQRPPIERTEVVILSIWVYVLPLLGLALLLLVIDWVVVKRVAAARAPRSQPQPPASGPES